MQRRDARWFSVAILVTCVATTAVGLAVGLYLDQAPRAATAPAKLTEDALTPAPLPVAAVDMSSAPDATSPTPSAPAAEEAAPQVQAPPAEANRPAALMATAAPAPVAAVPPSPTLSPDHVDPLAAFEPRSGTSAAELASASQVAMPATVAIPAPPLRAATGRYWVEYAVFAHKGSAEHLRHALATLHLETSVVATHAPDGRRLWRVRSAMAELADGEADARLARKHLGLKPLLHRAAPRHELRAQYWVQFGAFPTIAPAVHLQQVLAANGVKANVRHTRTSTGKPLFLVRSDGFPDRKLAMLVGELGASAAKVAFIVGRSPPMRHAAGHHAGARGAIGSSLPPHHHVRRPGG